MIESSSPTKGQSLFTNKEDDFHRSEYDEESTSLLQEPNENAMVLESFSFKFTPYKQAFKKESERTSFTSKTEEFKTRSFFSTPSFIEDLTEISVNVLEAEDKMKFLHSSLHKMNKNLPAMTYLPILSQGQRNYMILKIAEQESRLFITAQKAPFLICLEVFQPQELQLEIQQLQAKKRPRAFEILNKFNIINRDSSKLLQKINSDLSSP
jgi:hypothetical protein